MTSLIVSGLPRGRQSAVVGLAGAAALAFATGFALPRESLSHEIAWGLAAIAAVALCLFRVLTVSCDRGPWIAIALGLGLRVAAGLLGASSAPPDLIEVGPWIGLSGILPLYVGIGLLISRQLSDPGSSFWLDGLISALSISALVAALVLEPLAAGGPASMSSLALALAFPVGDLILLAMIVGLYSFNRWHLGALWGLLASALVASLIGGLFAVGEIASSDALTTIAPTAFWTLGLLAFALAAWHRPSPRQPPRRGRGVELLVPAAALLTSTLVLTWDHFDQTSTASVLLASAALVAVVARGAWTLRDLRSLAAMKREALTDDLTGLANRRALYRALESSTSIGLVTDRRVALLLFDLDRFKDVNDALGHDVGDRLLGLVAGRLGATADSDDIIARTGADEFALLCETASEQEALSAADRVVEAFAAPFDLDGAEIHLELSVGIAMFPDHARDSSTLLRRADLAMHRAKKTRPGRAVFSPQRDESGRVDRLGLVTDIGRALERGQLEAFYQPQIALPSGRLEGAEAVVRWRHPERGVLGPSEFLPVIEQTGLMRRVTRAMLTAAVRQAAEWRRVSLPLSVAVNLSPTDLLDAEITDDVAALLDEHDLPPHLLRIEITEQAAVQDLSRGIESLLRFKALGIEISLDDFGTGQSSLAHLKRMPVDELKIDRSFLLELASDPRDAALVTAAVSIGQSLGLRVVAEGVESSAAIDLLVETGCDTIQGFLVSRPLSARSFDLWRERWDAIRLAGMSFEASEE